MLDVSTEQVIQSANVCQHTSMVKKPVLIEPWQNYNGFLQTTLITKNALTLSMTIHGRGTTAVRVGVDFILMPLAQSSLTVILGRSWALMKNLFGGTHTILGQIL